MLIYNATSNCTISHLNAEIQCKTCRSAYGSIMNSKWIYFDPWWMFQWITNEFTVIGHRKCKRWFGFFPQRNKGIVLKWLYMAVCWYWLLGCCLFFNCASCYFIKKQPSMFFKALLSSIIFIWYGGINQYLQYICSICIKYVCLPTDSIPSKLLDLKLCIWTFCFVILESNSPTINPLNKTKQRLFGLVFRRETKGNET